MPLTLHRSSGGASNPLAHELIDRFGSLAGVLDAPPEELCKVKGMGIGVAAGIGVEEQQLQQLVVREGVRPGQKFGFQTLAVSVVGAHG